jgi:hypothetical protein
MEVKIGVRQAPRELVIDTPESPEDLEKRLEQAVADGGTFALTDSRGRRLLVPASGIAYVEMGAGVTGQVGFRS